MRNKTLLTLLSVVLILSTFVFVSCNTPDINDGLEHSISGAPYEKWEGYEEALNYEKLQNKEQRHLAIFKIDTKDELEQFKSKAEDQFNVDKTPTFNETADIYDEAFFAERSLLLVHIIASSSSHKFAFSKAEANNTTAVIYIKRTDDPKVPGNAMMAGWFITISVKKDAIKDITSFDAILEE